MDAFDIAKRDLKACYGEHGIFAGLSHFKDYWARDAFFASFGALELGDLEIVRKNIELFMSYSIKGQLPLRVGRRTYEIIISKQGKRRPIYTTDKTNKPSVDQNSLFISVLKEYTKKAGLEIVKDNKEKIKAIMDWNFKLDIDADLLIEETEYSNWADSLKKKGKVLYSNVCHIYALKCMSDLGFKEYLPKYKEAKKRLNELFWSGEHYIDWIDEEKHYNYFSTDGNFLAILLGISDEKKAMHIEEASHIFDIHDVPSRCVHPEFPKNYAYLPLRLAGLGDYHNGLSWIWLGCINALAKHHLGMEKEAKELMHKISKLIEQYGYVYEVYTKEGKPVNRLFYRAEFPFAWSSGMFVYAYLKIFGKKN